jgi:hypothetical protein
MIINVIIIIQFFIYLRAELNNNNNNNNNNVNLLKCLTAAIKPIAGRHLSSGNNNNKSRRQLNQYDRYHKETGSGTRRTTQPIGTGLFPRR